MLREQLMERLREDGIHVLTRTQINAVARLAGARSACIATGAGIPWKWIRCCGPSAATPIPTRSIWRRRE